MADSQVNSAKSVLCESLLHDEDCHKPTKITELPFAELWESRITAIQNTFWAIGLSNFSLCSTTPARMAWSWRRPSVSAAGPGWRM